MSTWLCVVRIISAATGCDVLLRLDIGICMNKCSNVCVCPNLIFTWYTPWSSWKRFMAIYHKDKSSCLMICCFESFYFVLDSSAIYGKRHTGIYSHEYHMHIRRRRIGSDSEFLACYMRCVAWCGPGSTSDWARARHGPGSHSDALWSPAPAQLSPGSVTARGQRR